MKRNVALMLCMFLSLFTCGCEAAGGTSQELRTENSFDIIYGDKKADNETLHDNSDLSNTLLISENDEDYDAQSVKNE